MFSDGSPEAPAYDPKNYGCEFHLYSTGYIRRALELKLRSWQEKRSPLLSRPLFTDGMCCCFCILFEACVLHMHFTYVYISHTMYIHVYISIYVYCICLCMFILSL